MGQARKSKGQLEAALSDAMVRMQRERTGRGPTQARTYLVEDMVIVRLQEVLTPAERQLLGNPHGQSLVKQFHQQLHEIARADPGRSRRPAAGGGPQPPARTGALNPMTPARTFSLLFALVLLAGCGDSGGGKEAGSGAPAQPPAAGGGKLRIAMIPKSRVAYFNACERGGQEAANELGDVEFTFEGPTEDKTEEQARILRAQSIRGVQAITIACNDANQIAPVIKEARDGGTHVLTYDSDANASTSGREFFVNQATVEDIAEALVEEMVAQVGPDAEVAVVSSTSTAPNQLAWLAAMKHYREQKYSKLKQVTIEYGGEDQALSMQKTQAILNANPNVKGLWAITSVAFPGAAQAVERAGKAGKIAVVGLSTPKEMAGFVDRGVVKTVILWSPVDLGYLTVYAARAAVRGELKPGMKTFKAGRLGEKQLVGDQILLGKPMRFTKENIHQFDF